MSGYRVNEAVVWAQVGDEIRFYDTQAGEFVALNATGAAIWRLLTGGADPAQIASNLADAYGALDEDDRRIIARDVGQFIGTLTGRSIILPADSPSAGVADAY